MNISEIRQIIKDLTSSLELLSRQFESVEDRNETAIFDMNDKQQVQSLIERLLARKAITISVSTTRSVQKIYDSFGRPEPRLKQVGPTQTIITFTYKE